jgi:magnesium-transporting ATPase (P-type)
MVAAPPSVLGNTSRPPQSTDTRGQPSRHPTEVRTDTAPLLLGSLLQTVVGMASRGLRCICLTYTDYAHDPNRAADFFEDSDRVDKDLIAMAIVGIKDPVRCVQHLCFSNA